MRRTLLRRLAPPLAAALSAAPLPAQTPVPVVLEGDAVPGVGNVTRIDNLAIDDAGEWLVEVDTDGADPNTDSVLLRASGPWLREGQALAAPAGASIGSFDDLWLDSAGRLGANFFLDGTAGSSDDSGVFHDDVLVIQESFVSTAPELSPGTPYIGFFGVKRDDLSRLVIMASVDDPAISTSVDRAIVLATVDAAGNLLSESVLAKEGDLLPGQTTETVTDFGTGPHDWSVDRAGDVMFQADLTGPTTANAAVYINSTRVAQEGDPSPVPGRLWSSLSSAKVDVASGGHWVLTGLLDGDTATNSLIELDGTPFRQEGDTLPAISPFVFTSFGTGPVHVSDAGDVLWYGDWDDPDTTRDTGLFLNDTLLVQEGVTTIGGVAVDTLRGIQDGYVMSENGRWVLFEAVLADGTEGAFLIDLGGPTAYCFGDGSGTPCPCGNAGAAGEGCANSSGAGAILGASGAPSVSGGTLVLTGAQLDPGQPGLYFQGDNAVAGGAGAPFGDGLRCAGGSVVRLEVVSASPQGTSQTSIDIAAKGGVLAGDTKRYQLWYRDPQGSPCGTGFNLSNGLELVWQP